MPRQLTWEDSRGVLELLSTIDLNDLEFWQVFRRQIISSLLAETGVKFAKGFLYALLQGVAREAKDRRLLVNPNPLTGERHSTEFGNPSSMFPSEHGWSEIKRILARTLEEAQERLARTPRDRFPLTFGF